MNELLRLTEHRPYPPPAGAWLMWQRWDKLLFAHWPVPAELLRDKIPASLTLDTFEGTAWIGIIPFAIQIAPRGLKIPPLLLRVFNEINVRTYVSLNGRHPGVWFFSLDASDALSVLGARLGYRLPYFNADIICQPTDPDVHYYSHRTDSRGRRADFEASYRPVSEPFNAQPGSLEYFLTERYCLYTADSQGKPYRGEIHHPAWDLQRAEAEITINTMALATGVSLPETAPHLLYAEHQDMLAQRLKPV